MVMGTLVEGLAVPTKVEAEGGGPWVGWAPTRSNG